MCLGVKPSELGVEELSCGNRKFRSTSARDNRTKGCGLSMALLAALIPAAASVSMLSTVRTPVVLRATTATMTMNVESWYDQGLRLSVNDDGMKMNLPAGMSASAAAANPLLAEKLLAYEADIAAMRARMDAFPKKEGTMFGARVPA